MAKSGLKTRLKVHSKSAKKRKEVTPPQQKIQRKSTSLCLGVFVNKEYKTCIALERKDDCVLALQISMEDGLHIFKMPEELFARDYHFSEHSPVERAAKIYAEFMQYLGATDDAIEKLSTFTTLTPMEVEMAKKKAAQRKNPPVNASSAKGKALAKAAETRAAKKKSDKPQTASQLFQKLIMDGKLTDDQIFAHVKEEFGLSDKKRGYVSWYRNYLKKNGENPPDALESKTDKKAASASATA